MLMGAYDAISAAHLLDGVLPTLPVGAKVVVAGAAYYQAKKAVRSLAVRAGTCVSCDSLSCDSLRVETIVHGRRVVGVPLGQNGERVRGERADLIVLVENFSIPREIVKDIVMGDVAKAS